MLTFQHNFLFERAQCYISFGPLLPGRETGEQPVPVHVSTVPKNDPIHWVSLTLKSLKEDSLPHDLCIMNTPGSLRNYVNYFQICIA